MQPSATNAVSGCSAQLEHQCPQCGAGVTLADTDRIFTCPFCRVRLFIAGTDYSSYFIVPSPTIDSRNCFFMPYFRLKGIRFALLSEKIVPDLVDSSVIAAGPIPGFPRTLGIRAQSMRMKFVEPASAGIFLPVRKSIESIKADVMHTVLADQAATAVRSLPLQSFVPEQAAPGISILIGETTSCVYMPYYIHNAAIFDAVSGSALCGMTENLVQILHDSRPAFPAFLSTLCPACGWDLAGERDSLVLLCGHCGCAWQARENTLQQLDISIWEPCSRFTADAWVPCWRLSVQTQQCRLSSVADFYRLTNTPKAVQPAMERQPFYLWTPAFKTHPELFLRLCRLLTLHQKQISDASTLPPEQKAIFFPVTLPSFECFEAVPVALADISEMKRKTISLVEKETFLLSSARLVLVPFILKGQEYFQPELNTVIAKNAFKWGRAL